MYHQYFYSFKFLICQNNGDIRGKEKTKGKHLLNSALILFLLLKKCIFQCTLNIWLFLITVIIMKCHEFKLWLFDINHNVPLCLWLVIGRKGVCHPVLHDTARLWRQASTRSTLFKFPLTEFCSSVSIASVSLDRGRVQATVSRIHYRHTISWWLNFTCRDHGSVSTPPSFPFLLSSPLCSPQWIRSHAHLYSTFISDMAIFQIWYT